MSQTYTIVWMRRLISMRNHLDLTYKQFESPWFHTDVANKIIKTWYAKFIETIFAPKHITYNLQFTNVATPKYYYVIL